METKGMLLTCDECGIFTFVAETKCCKDECEYEQPNPKWAFIDGKDICPFCFAKMKRREQNERL